MTLPDVLRSLLFVPGSRPDRIDKAFTTQADAVIIDLEDAVLPDQKDEARLVIQEKLGRPPKPAIVRINGLATPFWEADLDAAVGSGTAAVLLPKMETLDDVAEIHAQLIKREQAAGLTAGRIALLGLIETARGVANLYGLANSAHCPDRAFMLALGAADFTMDLGISMTASGEELHYPRARMAIASRSGELRPPVDTPHMLAIKDAVAVEADAQRAKALGFQGKLCIHPVQVDVCNRVFTPTPEEVAFAERVIAAFEGAKAQGQGAFQLDGKFIDLPILQRAQRIVKMSDKL